MKRHFTEKIFMKQQNSAEKDEKKWGLMLDLHDFKYRVKLSQMFSNLQCEIWARLFGKKTFCRKKSF